MCQVAIVNSISPKEGGIYKQATMKEFWGQLLLWLLTKKVRQILQKKIKCSRAYLTEKVSSSRRYNF